jgi:hypothetical protein
MERKIHYTSHKTQNELSQIYYAYLEIYVTLFWYLRKGDTLEISSLSWDNGGKCHEQYIWQLVSQSIPYLGFTPAHYWELLLPQYAATIHRCRYRYPKPICMMRVVVCTCRYLRRPTQGPRPRWIWIWRRYTNTKKLPVWGVVFFFFFLNIILAIIDMHI